MKVTILVKGKTYEIFGVECVEPMAAHKNGLFFYFISKNMGRWIRTIESAKIIEVRLCDLGNEFISYETEKALGWL